MAKKTSKSSSSKPKRVLNEGAKSDKGSRPKK